MLFKYALQIYVSYLSAVLPYDLYQHHGSQLVRKYNRLEWLEFSMENSNEIIKNVTKANDCDEVAGTLAGKACWPSMWQRGNR